VLAKHNMAALEKGGFVRREFRKTALSDYDTNRYHLNGLVDRIRKLEPDFAKEAAAKAAWRDARTDAELSPHRRRKKSEMGP
jgi:hypothetical protein